MNQTMINKNKIEDQPKQKRLKIVVIGDGSVGKTSFIQRLSSGSFSNVYLPTMGADLTDVDIDNVSCTLWDTAGQEKFGGLRDAFYLNADGILIFFDLTDKYSLKHVPSWYKEAIRAIGKDHIPTVIVGTKNDLSTSIKTEKIKYKDIPVLGISSKMDINVCEVIPTLIQEINKTGK